MRICLLSTSYPPANTEGIARQRQVLATELARRGHDVHIVTCGAVTRERRDGAIHVHEVAVDGINHYSGAYPELDAPLTYSQALYQGLVSAGGTQGWDVVDVPLWQAQGFVTLQRHQGPSVLWLQTSSAQLRAINRVHDAAGGRALLDLERICLARADGLLADSRSALDAVLRDYQIRPSASSAMVYLGLPSLDEAPPAPADRPTVEALVVGRLERRKGTHLLFELLPAVLRRNPQLRVRFVGRDNSAQDGWNARHGATYPEYFQGRHPGLADRVVFEGYVDESRLAECYRQADFLLAPSLYESFGLIYLEAMRAARPVVAFAAGGASEVFADGEAHGALLAPAGDKRRLESAIERLASQPELRRQLGERGLARFRHAFSAEAMADATLRYYEQVIAEHAARRQVSGPIFQVMEALDVGDAVSNIARRNVGLLAELGQPPQILARHAHDSLRDTIRPLASALAEPRCGLIFHYWGYNTSTWLAPSVRGRKAIHYHNITPPEFFEPDSEMRRSVSAGYDQLRRIANCFDLIVGDSRYNLAEYARFLDAPRPMLCLYPVVEPPEIAAEPYDAALLARLRQTGAPNLVFVGRIARNKRQDQLMLAFDHYWREIDRSARLWLVGNDRGDTSYRAELERLRTALPSGGSITFTGKVPDPQATAYYRAADVFVCASAHEGFCVPIAQAMALDVPVLAYAAAAVPETMGGAGVLIDDWQAEYVAGALARVLTDAAFREQLIGQQRASLSRFSEAEVRARLTAVVQFLQAGRLSPLFEET
jgi:glycosyltransferase involved in cell wall biosynthesis